MWGEIYPREITADTHRNFGEKGDHCSFIYNNNKKNWE